MSDTEGLSRTLASGGGSARASVPERYRFVERIGKGGMGEVHLWRDERTGRELAVKLALPSLDDGARRRFTREALLQARLEHPAFVPVYDVATADDGEQYFTMRRIQGHTLREVLEGKAALAPNRLLTTFVQLCRAVDFAHSRGVVHRDLKPENIMLGDFGEVYLLDWGIAKVSGELDPLVATEAAGQGPGTQHGLTLGTLGYMPPEQLRGEHGSLDARADVYALGAILFELLAGERLHRGDSHEALARSTLSPETDRSPARRAPGRDIAPELSALCERATEPEAAQRLKSAGELADAVERYLEGDRDLALRRQRARELAAKSTKLLDSDRVEAARLALRALAFDPDEAVARQNLIASLAEAPQPAPPEALAEFTAGEEAARRFGAKQLGTSVLVFMAWLVFALLAAGVSQPVLATVAIGLGVTSAGLSFVSARRTAPAWLNVAIFVLLSLSNAIFTRWTSPWVAIPMGTLGLLIAGMLGGERRSRLAMVAISASVMVVPQILESTGVLAPTWVTGAETYSVFPRMAGTLSVWATAAYTTLMLVVVALTMGRVLDRNRLLELRERGHAWLLKRVLGSG